jgi:hypothetical protein
MYARQTYRGRYPVINTSKYAGDATQVVYRSLWELKFMKWCDHNSAVLEWGSEEIVIPYLSPVDNRIHRYFVDFYMKIQNADGTASRYLIEIKPAKFTVPPVHPGRKTQRYIQEVMTWGVNQSKWKQATEFCDTQGWKFLILTEKELGLTKR